jgi:hypothetical protein
MKTLTVIFLSLCWLGVSATSWRVNNNPAINADFATFQEAHDAASPGDTIYVDGTGFDNHYGEVVIGKKLTIIGPGYFLAENDSTQASHLVARFRGITINPGAEGTEIYGLQLDWSGSGYRGIVINASNITIARNYFSDDRSKIYFGNYVINNIAILQNYAGEITCVANYTGSANNVLIANNFISSQVSNVASGVIVNNVVKYSIYASNSQIKNNIIWASSTYPFGSSWGSGNSISYNLVSGSLNSSANPPPIPGVGNVANVNMNTVFVDFGLYDRVDNDWLLKLGSPAIGAGENGIDCGIFGGPSPYVLSGLAPIPHIYEAIVPISGSAASGLPVTIKVKSQN